MKTKVVFSMFFMLWFTSVFSQQNWTHYVRTAGHGLNKSNIERTINDAIETNLFGIEVDNDIPGRYGSFLDPTEKLEALELMAKSAHAIDNHAFVYVTGTEVITGNSDQKEHTLFKDHPDWVQRDINNRPALFGGGEKFWINSGDEDVWVTPYAEEWRDIYMGHIRSIAKTGIDGIFVDVAYWMGHFDDWKESWVSFDDYTVKAFKDKTGLDARSDLILGDFSDANFRKWVDFRTETITNFLGEIDKNIKSQNPDGISIAEIWPGLSKQEAKIGVDTYQIYEVVDVIAHEYDGPGGPAASKNPLDWFSRMIGIYTFRAFAEGKATWMLSYSWYKTNTIEPQDPMKNLALSNIMAGANTWDARERVMSGSNDIETRKIIFKWIAENENTFYKPRTSIKPIGVYFSPKTKTYFTDDLLKSYEGIMNIMLQSHNEFQIVTPRTLKDFNGEILIFPDVKCVSDDEVNNLKLFLEKGKGLVVTGETGKYDISGAKSENNPIVKLLGIKDQNQKQVSTGKLNYIYFPECPGKHYSDLCEIEFNNASWEGNDNSTKLNSFRTVFFNEVFENFNFKPEIIVKASSFLSTQIAIVEGKPHIFIANYKGLKSDEIAKQIPENDVNIQFRNISEGKVFYLPYLGEKIELDSKTISGNLTCIIPVVEKGGVVWVE